MLINIVNLQIPCDAIPKYTTGSVGAGGADVPVRLRCCSNKARTKDPCWQGPENLFIEKFWLNKPRDAIPAYGTGSVGAGNAGRLSEVVISRIEEN